MENDTIYRQAAIRWVKIECNPYGKPTLDFESGKKVIEHLKKMPSAQPEQQWIPCSERLPKEEQKKYWICTDTGYQCECRWTNVNHFWTDLTTSWHWHIMDVQQYAKVVAWMPLPEPWKGGQDGH